MGWVFHIFLAAILYLVRVPIVATMRAITEMRRRSRAANWSTVPAEIVRVRLVQHGVVWTAGLFYEFDAHGQRWSHVTAWLFARERDADKFAERYRRGTQVLIRVRMEHPPGAVLLLADQQPVHATAIASGS